MCGAPMASSTDCHAQIVATGSRTAAAPMRRLGRGDAGGRSGERSSALAGARRPDRIEPDAKQPTNWTAIAHVRRLRAADPGDHLLGGAAHPLGGGFLHRRRRHHRACRTASRSPATTCRPPRSSASRRWSTPAAIDGLIYSIGFLVGWPIIMFLMAERLRNLGRFTFADVVSLPAAASADAHHGRRPARW